MNRQRTPVPRDRENDYSPEAARVRREFVREHTGVDLHHVGSFSMDPSVLPGNIENFAGVAQVPIGIAGPLLITGEHAQGEFYVPLATTEGTLVASYNRGMRLLNECGGVKTAVVDEHMQRAPVFILEDALGGRRFGEWVADHFADIKQQAETTTRSGKLMSINQYSVGPLRYLRFNYTTGDAAGQNMTGKATLAACEWIQATYPGRPQFILSGAIDTDKKHSQINMLQTRGKRVVAEAVIKNDVIKGLMGVDTKTLFWGRQISLAGSFMAASANNGAHAANGLTAMFIACGQDVACVAESAVGVTRFEVTADGALYASVTLPSIMVGTVGGGTGLPSQKACLDVLGLAGPGKAQALAEVCAALCLAGELSIIGALCSGDFSRAHRVLARGKQSRGREKPADG